MAALLVGCASVAPLGEPLRGPAGEGGYRFRTSTPSRRTDDLLLLVTLSGGGNRAAALAYGTLAQLGADRVRHDAGPRPLLDEVDVISAVSGGSIVGAYYALHGDGLFRHFLPDYLYRNAQSDMLRSMFFWPGSWFRLASPQFGRGDLFARYLDRHLFRGATFADLARQRDRPFLIINATDLSAAGRFEFTQDWFDILCTDLDRYPLARAVAASSAFPVWVTPITLANHAGGCGYQAPPGLVAARQASVHSREGRLAERLGAYQDPQALPYLHLADGALSDNLGVRPAIDVLVLARDFAQAQRRLGLEGVRRVAVIAVDAGGESGRHVARRRQAPGAVQTATLASQVLVDEAAQENRTLLREQLAGIAAEPSPAGAVTTYWIDVALSDLPDPAQRERLRSLPTALSAPRPAVDELVCAAGMLLRQSAAYQRLVRDLGGELASGLTCAAPGR